MAGYDEFTFDLPDAALTDFSLMLDLSLCSASWWAAVDTSDGTKGRAYKQDGTTRLAVDWIDFDDVAETGFARILWSGTLPTSGTIKLRIEPPQAANSSVAASDTYGSDNAYDSNTLGYWPLHDANDRTSGGHNLTAGGGLSFGGATGQVGDGTSLNAGSSQFATAAVQPSASAGTVRAWFNPDVTSGTSYVFSHYNSGNRIYLHITNNRLFGGLGGSFDLLGDIDSNVGTGTLYQGVVTWDGTNGRLYFNGVETDSDTYSGLSSTATLITLGKVLSVGYYDGVIDDAALDNVARSAAWIKHEYDQTNDPATFWGSATWVPDASGYTLTADAGSFTFAGVATAINAARQLPAAAATFALTGTATGLATARKLPTSTGTFTLTGIDATLRADRSLPASTGNFTLSGVAAGLRSARQLPASSATFVLTGIDVTLTYGGINSYTLTCDAGTFTFTGIDAALAAARKIAAATGTFALTGIDAGFAKTRRLACDVSAYTLTGQAVTLDYSGAEDPSLTLRNLKTISRPIAVKTISRPIVVHTVTGD